MFFVTAIDVSKNMGQYAFLILVTMKIDARILGNHLQANDIFYLYFSHYLLLCLVASQCYISTFISIKKRRKSVRLMHYSYLKFTVFLLLKCARCLFSMRDLLLLLLDSKILRTFSPLSKFPSISQLGRI